MRLILLFFLIITFSCNRPNYSWMTSRYEYPHKPVPLAKIEKDSVLETEQYFNKKEFKHQFNQGKHTELSSERRLDKLPSSKSYKDESLQNKYTFSSQKSAVRQQQQLIKVKERISKSKRIIIMNGLLFLILIFGFAILFLFGLPLLIIGLIISKLALMIIGFVLMIPIFLLFGFSDWIHCTF